MYNKVDQGLLEQYQFILNSTPYMTGNCQSWELGEGIFSYENEDIMWIHFDKYGNFRCYDVSLSA